jgi:hypothetical protein
MCLTSARISPLVSEPPNGGIRGLRFITAPPEAIVSKSESSGLADMASREEWVAGFTGRRLALGPSPSPDSPWHAAHHLA